MGTMRKVDFEHPGDIPNLVRSLSGAGADSIPDVREGYNHATGAGYLPSIAIPGDHPPIQELSQAELDTVIPVNSPKYRQGHGLPAPATPEEEAEDLETPPQQRRGRTPPPETSDYVSNSENFIDLDAKIGALGGHTVTLAKSDLATIKAVLSRAVQRQLIDEALRVKKAYGRTVQPTKRRSRKKMPAEE